MSTRETSQSVCMRESGCVWGGFGGEMSQRCWNEEEEHDRKSLKRWKSRECEENDVGMEINS